MKKLLLALSLTAAASANATTYNFTWQGDYGYNAGSNTVTGSFDGTANGNVISNLSNISVFINGNAFNGNGNLYGSSLGNWNWVSGGAQASFDGTQNNFLFINSDYPNNYSYTNYFYSVYGGTANQAYNFNDWSDYSYAYGSLNSTNWSVTAANVPEPSSIALFGLGLLALARFRKTSV